MEKKPARILRSVLLGILLFVVTAVLLLALAPPSVIGMPHIISDDTGLPSPPVISSHTFPFQETNVTISVPVNRSVYAGAGKAGRDAIIVGNQTETNIAYYSSMINDPSQEGMYDDLLQRFREVKSARNLSDDEYLELMTVYVQSLPYVMSEDPAKFPVETVTEMSGDCDDKSLLLAGLLSREGYPVALFLFVPEKHMAVGVGSDDFHYKTTGYSYIEATQYSYVGVPSYTLKGNGTLKSDPLVFTISSGTKAYHAGSETSYIDNMSALAGRRAADLSRGLRSTSLASATNRPEYLADFHLLDHYSEVHNYVLSHKFDRSGVVEYLKREMPEEEG